MALEFIRDGMPIVIVNPTVPLGERDIKPTPSGANIINIVKKRLPGYIAGGINLIDVRDCATGIVNAMAKGKRGEKYILGNRNVTLKEFFDLIVKVTGEGWSPFIRFPRFMAVQSGYGYEMLARITKKPPINTAAWVRVGSSYSWWDCSKAVKQLSLPQTPIEESIDKAYKWFKSRGYV